MKTIKNIIAIVAFISAVNANAQSNKPLTAIFKQSYEYEAMKNYEGAINTINSMYSETSYEINLRLGWLNYLSGKQKESISFYQKAISIMPEASITRATSIISSGFMPGMTASMCQPRRLARIQV